MGEEEERGADTGYGVGAGRMGVSMEVHVS